MQTFLPFASFTESARVLDNKRLCKQRVEAYQILRTLLGESKGWQHHPAVKQWRGFESSLAVYGGAMCVEWIERGYKDSLLSKFLYQSNKIFDVPKWLGNPSFHASHRSNLLRKDLAWYGQFGWTEPDNLPYVWPSKEIKIVQQKA